jgi:putative endonuclease
MAKHNQLGIFGEKIAANFLSQQGYKILETNWRFEKKEIDIIALINNIVVVVEVKARSTDFFGRPEEAVTRSKQRLLIEAADNYMQQINFEAEVRYDIISIILKSKDDISIGHIKDAFIPTLD